MDDVAATLSLKNGPYDNLQVLPLPMPELDFDYGVFSMRQDIIEQYNKFLAEIKADGTLKDMQERWLKSNAFEAVMPEILLTGKNGTLTAAIMATYPPFTFMGENGEFIGFDIEQFYTLQLIKSGNFHKAESSVDNLIARVRTLIRRERDYREDVIRNPQVIFFDKRRNRRKSEEEIKAQFEEEQKVFQDMFSWKKRIESFPEEQRLEAELVFENLERARMLHNELAKLVVENMALELKVRVEYPESFWRTSNLSFKKDIWQNTVIKYGLDNFDKLEYLLNPLFSADVEFIYPLDWAWEEQTIKGDSIITDLEKWEDEEELSWEEKGVDWEQLTMLYTPVFRTLLEKGEFHYSSLNSLELKERQVWTEQKENIDMLMMLAITGVTLTTAYNMAENVDERLELFRRICERNPDIRELEGKTITSYIDKNDKWIIWDEVNISPYVIRVE